jgi:signal transduction histidine kinase
VLEREHYTVKTVESGFEAIQAIPEYQPELVLLDILMPGMDGIETCRRIRNMPDHALLPIIFLTADERVGTHKDAFQAKGDDFLRKPVLPAELIVRIRSLMRLKRLQAEIHAERDALIESHKQKEQLFQFIVHDLKNPLTTIQLGADLLCSNEAIPPSVQPQLARMSESANLMDRMIQNILVIGRAEQIGLKLRRSRISLRDWIPGLLREVEYRAQRLQQSLAWECAENVTIEADQDLMRRVILNLLDNALKHASPGGRTQIEVGQMENGVCLKVRDSGQGIPVHLREAIFQKFFCLNEEGARNYSNNGLGLAFCQVVVQAHGGRIWVEDSQPHGSVFIFEIPTFDPSRTPVFT